VPGFTKRRPDVSMETIEKYLHNEVDPDRETAGAVS